MLWQYLRYIRQFLGVPRVSVSWALMSLPREEIVPFATTHPNFFHPPPLKLTCVHLPWQYTRVLQDGCRCVEIDSWDGRSLAAGPIVTHGHTLCGAVTFREVVRVLKRVRSFPSRTFFRKRIHWI